MFSELSRAITNCRKTVSFVIGNNNVVGSKLLCPSIRFNGHLVALDRLYIIGQFGVQFANTSKCISSAVESVERTGTMLEHVFIGSKGRSIAFDTLFTLGYV